ncbi:MAG: tRNA-guanine(15) transglycosylase [Candidatus Altiarchaeales archaeon ex4484_2]|nr:MAG: tRNA-guanine(15) transglycosylase [Candidatus Altiarchaeales archaeon ex4484_2]
MGSRLSFEVKAKDIGARVGLLEIGGKKIETPALMPVVNPRREVLSPRELREEFNVSAVMTNAYILLRDEELRGEVLDKGVHGLLGFDGVVATDSGSFQLMQYGNVLTSNKEIIGFQNKIGSDIGSFLDIPSMPDAFKARAEEQLDLTLERAKEARGVADFIVNAGIQGSSYLDLRARAAKEIGEDFRLCAVGGIVGIMEDYRFSDLVDIIATVKKNIPLDRVVHAFGLGHPMVFSLAAALGCDLFDSAAYALYARDGRYLTAMGTLHLDNLSYLPCCCPVCSRYGLELKELEGDEKVRELARHNLYVSFEELARVKQAIHEGSLWNLLSVRLRSHPLLLSALQSLSEHGEWLSTLDRITGKSSFYHLGPEAEHRTEVINVRERLKRVDSKRTIKMPPFGDVPVELSSIYPFVSYMAPDSVGREEVYAQVRDIDRLRAMMDYQFGSGAGSLIPERVRIKNSRRTGRMRWVYLDGELFASLRASDNWIIPKEKMALSLREKFPYPLLRVSVDDEAKPFVEEGKSVFCKFVLEIDDNLRCMDEVLVVDKDDNLIRVGTLHLSPREVMDYNKGMAVRVR